MFPLLLLLIISSSTAINLRRPFPVPLSLTISGQILFVDNHQSQITANSRLNIRLRDVFSQSNRSLIITSKTLNASIFPIQFNISYNPNVVFRNHIHVIDAMIFNEANTITFQSDHSIAVTLLGPGRTTYVDIALRAVYPFTSIPIYQMHEWPQLLGMAGFDAMIIIKKETGFKNVFIVTDESQIPKDLRHDRVFIFVDDYGYVQRVPSVG